jgi:hypothetical protein
MRILDRATEMRLQEIKDAHAKRHTDCTSDNCHSQYMIGLIEELKNRIANAAFLVEMHRL